MVSIIVPVYNAQRYLHRCVASILEQSLQDIQLILVDDGSADGSGTLCDEFAAKDSRVTVLHQKNAGVSAARNAGLAVAKGEFVGFVDADDAITPDAYEQAVNAIGAHDMAMWDAVTVWPDGRREPDTISLLKTDCVLEKKDWSPELLRYMAGAAWRCLYRRELLEEVRFPLGIKLSEDRLFNIEAMGKAKSLVYCKRELYLRSIEEGSACLRYHGDRFQQALAAADLARGLLEKHWGPEYIPGYDKKFIVLGALDAIREICGQEYPGKNRRKAIAAITANPALRSVFEAAPAEGMREKLLQRRMNLALLLLEKIK